MMANLHGHVLRGDVKVKVKQALSRNSRKSQEMTRGGSF